MRQQKPFQTGGIEVRVKSEVSCTADGSNETVGSLLGREKGGGVRTLGYPWGGSQLDAVLELLATFMVTVITLAVGGNLMFP